jgi:thioredoxin reductase
VEELVTSRPDCCPDTDARRHEIGFQPIRTISDHRAAAGKVGNRVVQGDCADALFLLIGVQPRTEWLSGTLQRDPKGFIFTGRDLDWSFAGGSHGREPLPLETSMHGVFAVGDVRLGSTKRIASAVGEGAMAVQYVHAYLDSLIEADEDASRPGDALPAASRATHP